MCCSVKNLKLLTRDDARPLGCEDFDSSGLPEENGRFILLAAPMHHGKVPEVHDGTVTFEFESLAEGRLRRDADHLPSITKYIAPQSDLFSLVGAGQATYDPRNTHDGLIMPQFNVKTYPEVFPIFQTGLRIIPQN